MLMPRRHAGWYFVPITKWGLVRLPVNISVVNYPLRPQEHFAVSYLSDNLTRKPLKRSFQMASSDPAIRQYICRIDEWWNDALLRCGRKVLAVNSRICRELGRASEAISHFSRIDKRWRLAVVTKPNREISSIWIASTAQNHSPQIPQWNVAAVSQGSSIGETA
jgi:hypothetical protein